MLRLPTLCVSLLALAAPSLAGDGADWSNLSRLRSGDRIRVAFTTGKSVTTQFQSWTPESISFAAGNQGPIEAKRDEVRKIERLRSGGTGTRGKHAALGFGIGFGAGFGLGAALPNGGTIGPHYSRPVIGGVFGGLFGGVGTLVGALLPPHHADLIYKSQ